MRQEAFGLALNPETLHEAIDWIKPLFGAYRRGPNGPFAVSMVAILRATKTFPAGPSSS